MSKVLLSLITILTISCGKVEEQVQDGSNPAVGNQYILSEIKALSTDESNAIQVACNALKSKKSYFRSTYLDRSTQFSFKNTTTACGSNTSTTDTVYANIKSDGSSMIFKTTGTSPLLFSDIIDSDSSDIASFCTKVDLGTLDSKYISENSFISVISAKTSGSYTKVAIETGYKYEANEQVKITTLKGFNILTGDSPNKGMLVERALESSGGCSQGMEKLYYSLLEPISI